MDCKTTSRANRRPGGFTLVEFMVASGLAAMVMAGAFSAFLFISRFSVPMMRNVELDRQVRNSLGWVTREIREATNVAQLSTNLVVITTPDLGAITYKWNGDSKTVERIRNGTSKILLTECDYFRIGMLQALPVDGQLALEVTTNLFECKALTISSQCSRPSYMGSSTRLTNTASATAILRVKPIHN